MAPSRPPSKKDKNEKGHSVAGILADAETQLQVGNLDEAIALALQAHETTGEGGDFELRALNLLGILYLEAGEVEEARELFEKAVTLDEDGTVDEKVGGGPDKFMFLAQLSEEGGQDSVTWFERGAAALRRQIQDLTETDRRTPEQQESLEEKQGKLGGVLCAVAEVYMTDLSWEDDAEKRCDALVTEAMMIAPKSPETWQTVANVRISQERFGEARQALRQSLELWKDLPAAHPTVPEFPTRISLVRLLLEVELEEEALGVLHRLVTDDDQSVEAWYLGGWCLYNMGEKLREGKESTQGQQKKNSGEEEEEWEETWRSARKWLSRCLKLFEVQEYEDERLGQHAVELRQSINKVLGEPAEGEDEDWDDGSDEDSDEDEEMQG